MGSWLRESESLLERLEARLNALEPKGHKQRSGQEEELDEIAKEIQEIQSKYWSIPARWGEVWGFLREIWEGDQADVGQCATRYADKPMRHPALGAARAGASEGLKFLMEKGCPALIRFKRNVCPCSLARLAAESKCAGVLGALLKSNESQDESQRLPSDELLSDWLRGCAKALWPEGAREAQAFKQLIQGKVPPSEKDGGPWHSPMTELFLASGSLWEEKEIPEDERVRRRKEVLEAFLAFAPISAWAWRDWDDLNVEEEAFGVKNRSLWDEPLKEEEPRNLSELALMTGHFGHYLQLMDAGGMMVEPTRLSALSRGIEREEFAPEGQSAIGRARALFEEKALKAALKAGQRGAKSRAL